MLLDIVTIFPDYMAPLELSLLGKARRSGRIRVRVHDLRDFTQDRHRTVDDTPYGGGAGMVMKPEPWALALEYVERLGPRGDQQVRPLVLFPAPSGEQFRQPIAETMSQEPWIIFACGRYEGIDERVMEWAKARFRVRRLSLGDYVINGGEAASLVMIEAIVRLVPGVVGNPESLVEESHSDGFLEYPLYTKPASWRGHTVPDILLSGNHAEILRYRQEEKLRRTAEVRPELLENQDPPNC